MADTSVFICVKLVFIPLIELVFVFNSLCKVPVVAVKSTMSLFMSTISTASTFRIRSLVDITKPVKFVITVDVFVSFVVIKALTFSISVVKDASCIINALIDALIAFTSSIIVVLIIA